MNTSNKGFPALLSDYFQKYLPSQRGVSMNTIKSYRDTFVVFFRFLERKEQIYPNKISFQALNSDLVERFLEWLELENNNSISTRNHRLATLHSFMKYVMAQHPEFIEQCSKVLAIRSKKRIQKPPVYLSVEEVKCVFSQPDIKTAQGLRDLALLTLLYDSGCRVQELIDLTWFDMRIDKPSTITLTGKGGKSRIVPLMPDTSNILFAYKQTLRRADNNKNIFLNQSSEKLSRSGVEYIVEKYVTVASEEMPSLKEKKVTPHVYRHSKAMHLTQADVNIIYIRDFLGHSSIQVTERYARADSRSKRKALEKASKNIVPESSYSPDEEQELLAFLKELL